MVLGDPPNLGEVKIRGTEPRPVVPTRDSLIAALRHALQPGVAARAQSTAGAVHIDGANAAAERLMAAA